MAKKPAGGAVAMRHNPLGGTPMAEAQSLAREIAQKTRAAIKERWKTRPTIGRELNAFIEGQHKKHLAEITDPALRFQVARILSYQEQG
jgi:hypothetical protein